MKSNLHPHIQKIVHHATASTFSRSMLSIVLLLLGLLSYGQNPVPDFTANVTTGCAPLSVQFTDRSSGNPIFWNWDLGNGQLSTLQNPSTVYSTPGIYTVTLVARNANGISSVTKTNYIVVNASPTARFSANITTACLPAAIQFTDNSIPNAGTIVSWEWDFGDGNTSTLQNPTHTYTTTGFYTVYLKVTSSTGCSNLAGIGNYIRVVSGVTADFDNTAPATCRPPFLVNFRNLSSGPGTISYNWDFGNSTSSTVKDPVASFAGPGSYTVTLNATSQFGCGGTIQKTINIPNTTTSFASPDSVCLNTPISFQNTSTNPVSAVWDFGNGSGSTNLNDNSVYTTPGDYTIKLINTYSNCTDSVTRPLYVRPRPTVDFSAPVTAACQAPFIVNFQDLSPDAQGWQWDFGDGGTSTIRNPSHTYNTSGQFTVRLTITDSKGCVNTITKSSFVRIIAPSLSISNAPNGGCAPFNYAPIAAINAIDGVASYLWDFGDGFTSTAANPNHTYPAPGSYTIRLTITTTGGCTASVQYTNGIRVGTPPLTNFSFSPSQACASGNVQFTDLSATADSWVWNFGDGNTSNQQNPIHQFTDTGFFNISLTAVNNGCSQTFSLSTPVHVLPPVASFTHQITCTNKRFVTFTNTSKTDPAYGAISYLWEFGDPLNSTANILNPTFTYPGLGTYPVKLTVTNGTCSQSITSNIVINGDIADFTVSKVTLCRNEAVTFTAINSLPANITDYKWSFDGGPYVSGPASITNTFSTTGPHSVSLIINDINGCSDTLSRNNVVQVSGATALFSVPVSGGCKNNLIPFTDASSSTGSIVSWRWVFDDGQSQTFNAPPFTHVYTDTGIYYPSLIVTDNIGCTDSIRTSIPIWITSPKAGFSIAPALVCAGVPVQFTDSSKGYGLNYQWTLGDGNSSGLQHPIHSYAGADNIYSVRLVITDTTGCTDTITKLNSVTVRSPKPGFTVKDSSSICQLLETKFTFQGQDYESFYWDFGDGTTSTQLNPRHFYNTYGSYTAKLVLTGFGGCMDSSSAVINVYNPSTATTFTYSPIIGCNSVLTDFTINNPPSTKLFFYSGDGYLDSLQRKQFQYNYRLLGFHTPSIGLRDSTGCFVTLSGPAVRVLGAEPLFGLDKKAFCDSGMVAFGNFTINNDPIVSSVWDFGDGNTSTVKDPTHNYTRPGTFVASLTVNTQSGCSKTLTDTVRVYGTPLPIINSDTIVCIGENLLLLGSLAVADTAITWRWDNGNGSSSATQNSITNFSTAGRYTVRLDASNKLGCAGFTTRSVFVPPTPVATFTGSPVIPVGTTIPIPVTYSPNVDTYIWTPITGLSCNTCPFPIAGPKSTTKYKVNITDIYGCTNSNEITIVVVCNDKNFFIPNTFSPNNDGNNDIFYPRGTGLARVQSMRIFNRWGQMVYERRNFNANDPSLGWDGTFNGKKGEADTYVYMIELVCENSVIVPYKGNVTLIR